MNIQTILNIFLWAGSIPLILIILAVFTIKKNMVRGYWVGFLLLLFFVFTGTRVIEPSMSVNYILKFGSIFSIPYLAIFSLFAVIMESLSWFLGKQNISGRKYNWWIVGMVAIEMTAVVVLILWTPRVMGFLPPFVAIFYYYWWIFAGLIVLWIGFYLQRSRDA